jgi:hypothetical protein
VCCVAVPLTGVGLTCVSPNDVLQLTSGLWFYVFPYVLLLVGGGILTVTQSHAADSEDGYLLISLIKNPRALAVLGAA